MKGITTFASTIDRGVAQLASAHVWGTWGRKFESSHPDQIKRNRLNIRRFRYFYYSVPRNRPQLLIKSANQSESPPILGLLTHNQHGKVVASFAR